MAVGALTALLVFSVPAVHAGPKTHVAPKHQVTPVHNTKLPNAEPPKRKGALKRCITGPKLYVTPKASKGKSVGPSAKPFATIHAALAYAAKHNHCKAEVGLTQGTHHGSVVLTRHTKLFKAGRGRVQIRGTITSRGPFRLDISNVTFRDTNAAAIFVQHRRARTTLRNVVILNAKDYGLRHIGGHVTLDGVTVSGTRATGVGVSLADYRARSRGGKVTLERVNDSAAAKGLGTGIGVSLTAGVRGMLRNVTLVGNASQALLVRGAGTKVDAQRLIVNDTRHHPLALARDRAAVAAGLTLEPNRDGLGAIQVDTNAAFQGEGLKLHRNQYMGIYIGGGARAHVRNSSVRKTTNFPDPTNSFQRWGGHNIYVDGGMLEIGNFSSKNAASAGIAGFRSFMKVRDGTIANNNIGIAMKDVPAHENYDVVYCLSERVRFINNQVNADLDSLPVPNVGVSGLDDVLEPGSEPRRWCPSVPWR